MEVLSKTAGDVLGLIPDKTQSEAGSTEKLNQVMDVILKVRKQLRKEKNFQLSDTLRSDLEKMGIKIKDTPDGATWESE